VRLIVRTKAFVALLSLMLASVFAGAAAITPTTTLSAETGNNTSAGLPATQSNGNTGATNISKVDLHTMLPASASNLPILAVYQPWFRLSYHMEIGIDEMDPAKVAQQVEDAQSRGISGFMVNWYGQPINSDKKFMDDVTKNVRDAAEAHNGFTFALQYDGGAYKTCNCDKTAKFIADMQYARTTYFSSPAYLKVNNRPVVEMFSVDEDGPVDWTAIRTAVPEVLMIFRNSQGWNHAQSDGMFGWLGINLDPTKALSYDTDFYWNARQHTDKLVIAPIWLGFNDTLASWGSNRIAPRNCAQTYLKTLADASANVASINFLEVNTWNDYEEGTEFESGIDNCVSVTASMAGTALNWAITGAESTVDHYDVFASVDGQNFAKLATVAAGTGSLDLAQFNLDPAAYSLFVKAVGKAQITNKMSPAVAFTISDPGPTVSLNVTPNGGIAPVTVGATVSATTPYGTVSSVTIDFGDGTVTQAFSASHAYSTAGTYIVTGKVTDSFGTTNSKSTQVTVVPNKPPVASISLSMANGVAPAAVTASSVGSSDPDGTIVASTISFGDGSPVVSGSTASHTYAGAGTYNVITTVTDDKGAKTSATATVAMTAPGVTMSLPTSGSTMLSPVHVVASSGLPTGRTMSSLRVYVDGASAFSTTATSLDTNLTVAPGTHSLFVQATDNTGASYRSTTSTITVQAPAPTAGIKVSSPAPGATVTSPAHFIATATAPSGRYITTFRIYVSGVSAYTTTGGKIDKWLSMTKGTHPVVVQAWDNKGSLYKWTTTLTVK
jgi:PKD repeat protein